MDGVHDMGGMHGFGSVVGPGSDVTHTEPWEVRAQVISLLSNRDSRALIEQLEPDQYLSSSYYARWLAAAEQGARNRGVEETDLGRWHDAFAADEDLRPPVVTSPERLATLKDALARASELAPASDPDFAVGERVRVRRNRIEQHHRCPRYARGAEGAIERICGDDQIPGTDPSEGMVETVYTVRFSSVDLWGKSETEPRFAVLLDLWESYLEPA